MKFIKRFVFALVMMIVWAAIAFFATVEGWIHSPIANRNSSTDFYRAVDAELNKQFVGDFALAIFDKGNVKYEKFHTVGNGIDRNTLFQVSSLSKWISAFGIMKLVQDGKINLDSAAGKYIRRWALPPTAFNNNEVTIRRLLSHTAGLTDDLGYSGFESTLDLQSLEQSLTHAKDADDGVNGSVYVGIQPGSEFRYSGGGYTLLQLVVEEVSNQSFDSYMKQHIFQPLGMNHSTYVWSDTSAFSLAACYAVDSSKLKQRFYTSQAATGLYTSLADLELFFKAHLEGGNGEPVGRGVINPETVKLMRAPHGNVMGVDIWGLGTVLYAETNTDDFIIGHDGKSTPAVNTAIRLNPETGDGIIILETGNPGIATKLASEWVFWKTGKVDTFLFPMLINKMILIIAIGWILIIGSTLTFGIINRSKKKK